MCLGWGVVSTAIRRVFTKPISDQGMKQDGLDPFHPLRTDPVAELDHRGGIQNLTTLEGVESAEALPVGVLMKHLNRPVVRTVVPVLQNVDAHHQSNGFAVAAHGTVVN